MERARFYSAEYGRFLSVDPLAGKFPGWSSYNYVLGNPVILIDRDGNEPTTIFDGILPEKSKKADPELSVVEEEEMIGIKPQFFWKSEEFSIVTREAIPAIPARSKSSIVTLPPIGASICRNTNCSNHYFASEIPIDSPLLVKSASDMITVRINSISSMDAANSQLSATPYSVSVLLDPRFATRENELSRALQNRFGVRVNIQTTPLGGVLLTQSTVSYRRIDTIPGISGEPEKRETVKISWKIEIDGEAELIKPSQKP
ncbi:MAG: RHS repeat-associated core domain-containing protein [Bacteroidota bacterium]